MQSNTTPRKPSPIALTFEQWAALEEFGRVFNIAEPLTEAGRELKRRSLIAKAGKWHHITAVGTMLLADKERFAAELAAAE